MADTCQGVNVDGSPCGTTFGLSSARLCIVHDPDRQSIARAMRSAGGRGAGEARRARREAKMQAERDALAKLPGLRPAPKSVADAMKALSWLYFVGASGQMDASTVRECSGALKAFIAAADKAVLERKLKQYEKALGVARSCNSCGPQVATLLAELRK